MGLDGISINQLRILPENNSAELNNPTHFSLENAHKVVDGLANGQKVDPDKEREHENPQLLEQYVQEEADSNEDDDTPVQEVVKYDLSESSKYYLKVDEETNKIMIKEKISDEIVQIISADDLSRFVGFLSNSQGSIVNRKF